MSRAGAQHLERRQGIYGIRIRVPDDIRPLLGMIEVRRSLRTSDRFEARVLSARCAARLFEVFSMVKNDKEMLAPDDVRAMIASCFRDMIFDAVNFTKQTSTTSGSSETPTASAAVAASDGVTLKEAIGYYLAAKQSDWTRKTFDSRRRRLAFLEEHLCGTTSLRAISADHVRSFRDAICRIRKRTGRAVSESFAAKQTANASDRIDGKTAVLIFEPTKAFFRWCKSEQGYIADNPAADIRLSAPKRPKGRVKRRPFREGELKQLFCSPLFTGCKSTFRRYQPGTVIEKDAKFWIPVLGYYTGARLGEIVQLHVADVETEAGIVYLRISEEVRGALSPDNCKRVKSEAGVRRIPLHDDVLVLGFWDFVNVRKRQIKNGAKRLFPEFKFGEDDQASTVASKWFGRLMSEVGLDDPALVFHSFRHNAQDAFRNALQPQYVIDNIIGHSDDATSSGYGEGISLAVAKEAVTSMKLEVRLPELWSSTG